MYSIARLEELIGIAENTLLKYEAESANSKSLFAAGMVKNTNERLGELRANLAFEKRLREVEVLDLRLIGNVAKLGRLPLELLGVFAKVLSDTIVEAGKQYQFGSRSGAKYQELTKKAINLRFERLVPGSTRILVTGSTNPDLFGNSILENALDNTFNILNIEDSQDLIESSEKIGNGGMKKLEHLLNVSSKNDLEFELEWKAPNSKTFKWTGDKQKIESLSHSLSSIQTGEPIKDTLTGILTMQSLKGQVEIKTNDKIVKISFANEMLEEVKKLQIGNEYSYNVTYCITTNKITNTHKYSYQLNSVIVS